MLALLASLALLCACTGGGGSESGPKTVVRVAQEAGTPPNWIFPILPGSSCTTENVTYFEYQLWRPLYWLGEGQTLKIDEAKSVAEMPTFGDKSVTITLKSWSWSDGKPITSRDLAFNINLLKTEPAKQYCFASQYMPSAILSYEIVDDKTIKLQLDRNYNEQWFTWNVLSVLMPLPHHAWGKTSDSQKIGDYDNTEGGATKVFDYLTEASKDISTYTSNPLWKVVGGPYQLKKLTRDGEATFQRNEKYSGPDKAKIETMVQVPFTDDAAQFAALLAGKIDSGYVPPIYAKSVDRVKNAGYKVTPQFNWGVGYYIPNLKNPEVGDVLKQTYIRQALQLLVPQDLLIDSVYGGFAYNTYGPVPLQPDNPFASDYEKNYPYTHDSNKAKALLADHGWSKPSDGGAALVCTRPGSGPDECGEGIPEGKDLTFEFTFASSKNTIEQQAQVLKSEAGKAGIVFNLKGEPYDTALSHHCPSDCSWQLLNFDRSGYQGVPTGEQKFAPGGPFNAGGYDDPKATELINRTLFTNDPNALTEYQDYLAEQVPWIWTPNPIGTVVAAKPELKDVVPRNVFNLFNPQDWHWSE